MIRSLVNPTGSFLFLAAISLFSGGCGDPLDRQARRLSRSLSAYVTGSEAEKKEAERTVLAMGTNALPFLTQWLTESRGAHQHRVPNAFAILGEIGSPAIPRLAEVLHGTNEYAAILAAQSLGMIGKPALPVLLTAVTNRSHRIASDAAIAIVELGTNALPAIPIFLSQLESGDHLLRERAADALGGLALEPERVVPALIRLLDDPSPAARFHAINSLAEFGPAAKAAVPDISALLTNPDLQGSAKRALREIDPEALKKASAQ